VGASLTLATVSLNWLLTEAPTRSVAVTFKLTSPGSALPGVPEKVRVVASN